MNLCFFLFLVSLFQHIFSTLEIFSQYFYKGLLEIILNFFIEFLEGSAFPWFLSYRDFVLDNSPLTDAVLVVCLLSLIIICRRLLSWEVCLEHFSPKCWIFLPWFVRFSLSIIICFQSTCFLAGLNFYLFKTYSSESCGQGSSKE